MADAPQESLVEAVLQRLQEKGICDASGRRLNLDHRPFSAVIGRVGDDEPLIQTEIALGQTMPERLVRGIGALAMCCQAQRIVLAVREDAPDVLHKLRAVAQETKIEVIPIPACSPLDHESLICDLAQFEKKTVSQAGLNHALVVDAVVLVDVALALEGRFPVRRILTVGGYVQEPAVVQAPLGTSMQDLVGACGGSPDLGWVPFHNGVLTGKQVGWDNIVDVDTRGVVVLPHNHPLVKRAITPLSDQLARIASACMNCRICTDLCPVYLQGGHLEPHRIMQAIATGWMGSDWEPQGPVLSALECIECGICSPFCPTMLNPAQAIHLLTNRLKQQGIALAERVASRPHQDRLGRRISLERLSLMLGLEPYIQYIPERIKYIFPEKITLPINTPSGGERILAVRIGEQVSVGDVVALGPAGLDQADLHSPVSGTIEDVDPDDGLAIQPR